MGFGFVVARFGLFLRELQVADHSRLNTSPRLSLWIGIALVLMGVFVNLSAMVRQGRLIEQLKRGEWDIGHRRGWALEYPSRWPRLEWRLRFT